MRQVNVIILQDLDHGKLQTRISENTKSLCEHGIDPCDIEIQISRINTDEGVLTCADIFYWKECGGENSDTETKEDIDTTLKCIDRIQKNVIDLKVLLENQE